MEVQLLRLQANSELQAKSKQDPSFLFNLEIDDSLPDGSKQTLTHLMCRTPTAVQYGTS